MDKRSMYQMSTLPNQVPYVLCRCCRHISPQTIPLYRNPVIPMAATWFPYPTAPPISTTHLPYLTVPILATVTPSLITDSIATRISTPNLPLPVSAAIDGMKQLVLSKDELIQDGYPIEKANYFDNAMVFMHSGWAPVSTEDSTQFQCLRCRKMIPKEPEVCHWFDSKVSTLKKYHQHVHEGFQLGWNTVPNFVNTKYINLKNPLPICSIDCEMCITVNGLEVTRVSLVDVNGVCTYNSYVKPKGNIIDLCTEFSGVTSKDLENAKPFNIVRGELLKQINWRTILIGHALSNDLRVLKIIHDLVIDTSVVYPHERGWPYKKSLKKLCKEYLCIDIQDGPNGHDSIKDAQYAMKLTLQAWNQRSFTLFTQRCCL